MKIFSKTGLAWRIGNRWVTMVSPGVFGLSDDIDDAYVDVKEPASPNWVTKPEAIRVTRRTTVQVYRSENYHGD